MTVFIILYGEPYDGREVSAIRFTRHEVREFLASQPKKHRWKYDVEEWDETGMVADFLNRRKINMTWMEAISELCRQLDSENTIDDILVTAVDENMITVEQARDIAEEVHLHGSQFSFQTEF